MPAPTLGGLAASVTFAENIVNATPQLIDAAVVFLDADGDFDGGTLTVSGLLAEDRVSIRNQGTGAGQVGLSSGNVTYGGVVIGTATGGSGADFVVTFDDDATAAAIDAIIQNLTYANVSDTPTASRDLTIAVTDAGGFDMLASGVTQSFVEQTGAADPVDGIDVGLAGTPGLADLDDDGDLDLLVGELDGDLNYFENTGTASAPAFTERTGAANPFDGSSIPASAAPSFADLDDDGDLDVVAGDVLGALSYLENTGTASSPAFTLRTGAANPFNGVDAGNTSRPAFSDLDGDGDLDAVVGNSGGELNYFENTGTASAPAFVQRTGVANPFDGVDVNFTTAPSFSDVDGDGDFDAVVGDQSGLLHYFENTGTTSAPVFVQRTGAANPFNGVDVGSGATPTFGDLDSDGDLDALVGDQAGTLNYFENQGAPSVVEVNLTAQDEPNTAPTLGGLAATVTFAENTVNAAPQLIDSSVTFADAEGDFDGGTLTVSGLLAEDRVSIRNQGTAAGQVGFSSGNVTYGGVVIGTATGGSGSSLVVTFDEDATAAAIDAVIQNLTYANVSDAPTASRELTIAVTDAGGFDMLASGVTQSFTVQAGAANPFNGIDIGAQAAPGLGDLDDDGDLDLVVGDSAGGLYYFENTGTASASAFVQRTGAANPFDGLGVPGLAGPSFADLDGDGDLDAVVGDLTGALNYFENTGTGSSPAFTQRTGAANPFDGVGLGSRVKPAFSDLDGDGDLDALVGAGDGFLYYFENTGTAVAPVFTFRAGAANPFHAVDVGTTSAPSFSDVDGDGDFDAVVGDQTGRLGYFENTGTTSAPVFVQRAGAANPFNGVDFGIGSTPAFGDLDSDGDLDLIVGENFGTLFYTENQGAPSVVEVNLTAQAELNTAPTLGGLAATVTFAENTVNAAPQLINSSAIFADAEGDFDGGTLTVSGLLAEDRVSIRNQGTAAGQVGFSSGNVTYGGVVIGTATGGWGRLVVTFDDDATAAAIDAVIQNLTYANVSDTPTASRDLTIAVTDADGFDMLASGVTQSFTVQTGAANPFNGIDIDLLSTPALADLDGDGDLDAVVGEFDGFLNYFENTGTASAPVFVEQFGGDSPFDGMDFAHTGGGAAAPRFADLDGDGDLDAVIGVEDGDLVYLENTGTASAPAFTKRTGAANPFDGVDLGSRVRPAFADLDGDGDLDAVIGETDGTLNYFENTGTASAPAFVQRTGGANPFDGVDVGVQSVPSFSDVDGDGDLDAVVGEQDGTLNYFENTGTVSAPVFVARTGAANPFDGVDVGQNSSPVLGDLDADGDLDALIGEFDGTLNYFENQGAPAVVTVNVTAEAEAGPGSDKMAGGAGVNIFNGLGGDDVLEGGGGDDVLDGGADNDRLAGGSGDDDLDGGDGIDRVGYGNASAGVTVDLSLGTASGGDGNDTLANLENIAGSRFADILTGDDGVNEIEGGDGGDTISGKGQNDTLKGQAGGDTLNGDLGNDTLWGGAGDDDLHGGDGVDRAVYGDATSAVTVDLSLGTASGGAGNDTLDGVENLVGSTFSDTLTGDGAANTIEGGAGADTMSGNALNDILKGQAGADTLNGDAGADSLDGGDDDDTLTGGAGADTLVGGAGADKFVFAALADSTIAVRDLITDFTDADRLDLSGMDADIGTGADDDFHIGATPGHVGDIVVAYNASAGRTIVSLFVDGDAVADAQIALTGDKTAFLDSVGDFVL